jgi:hypothetical protein
MCVTNALAYMDGSAEKLMETEKGTVGEKYKLHECTNIVLRVDVCLPIFSFQPSPLREGRQ